MTFINENTGFLCSTLFDQPNTSVLNKPINTEYLTEEESTINKTATGGFTFVQNINSQVPDNSSVSQNYSNPFNPVTKIKFRPPAVSQGHSAAGGLDVQLIVYDVPGRENTSLIPHL